MTLYVTYHKPDARSDNVSAVPSAFVGSWKGVTTERNGQVAKYRTTLTLRDGRTNSEVGQTYYEIAKGPCWGTVRLQSASGKTLRLGERIDGGPCLPGGSIVITLEGPETLSFRYSGITRAGRHQTVEGSLDKIG
ncbi:hypothetical protein [Streptomyces sp. NBC_01296]|uniref:hypothetical protein n=1 Tax=Streptomyces sp. NBC_01296 TaxID=2903816 RepID=UPI002E0DA483|nr:hypothetical protein OG299_27500 [Streptomyces sp. NBC_01296]